MNSAAEETEAVTHGVAVVLAQALMVEVAATAGAQRAAGWLVAAGAAAVKAPGWRAQRPPAALRS